MSDLDFDELDKAVNSLVGDSDSGDKKDSAPTQESSSDNKPNDTAGKIGPSMPSRRSGRFMDMKHDSSDMQKSDSSLMNPSKTTVTPINPGLKKEADDAKEAQQESKSEKSSWPDPIDSAKSEDTDKADEKPVSSSTDMPDPLDHMSSSDTSDKDDKNNDKTDEGSPEKVESDYGDKKDEPELNYEETDPKKDEKKDSPFIDDAKVEKRPLGGFSSESPVTPPSEEAKEGDAKDSKDDKPPVEPVEPIELPPELDKDLVAIEAGETIETMPLKEEEEKSTEKDEKDEDNKDKDKKETAEQKDKVSELLASAATGSIPEQYKRQNRSHELHAPHPLFDADHYKNSPKVTNVKKPKSPVAKIFQWIFISLGLVLLGGSLGAAAYVLISKA